MQRTISTWREFQDDWDGVLNFLMKGDELVPFRYTMPSIERIVETLRSDPDTRITPGVKGNALNLTDIRASFCALPIEEAVRASVALAHFKLNKFFGDGQLLEGFEEGVMRPWTDALQEAGFTWTRCYPILFISGPGCATNYHLDFSQVIAWQTHGTKLFSGLQDPERWAPFETRLRSKGISRPDGLTDADALTYAMPPGTVLWNTFLTPHWVEASDQIACSINISHGGLRYKGKLCRHEQEIIQWQLDHPEEARLLF
ncbi:hypothetical protein [Paenibacillus koleovorans]|uniref:hypothetical protein n=1 Tax=Paenibacillus koleovorans TaxID=121608 RepID=UPI000FD6F393|nr:hypothetical protein [Paenibacillus koleovorans]